MYLAREADIASEGEKAVPAGLTRLVGFFIVGWKIRCMCIDSSHGLIERRPLCHDLVEESLRQ